MGRYSGVKASNSGPIWRNPYSNNGTTVPGVRVRTNSVAPVLGFKAIYSSTQLIRPKAMASNDSMIVCVGAGWNAAGSAETTTASAYSSADGFTWTARTITTGQWVDVVWTGTKFVALSTTGTITSSVDGITWQAGVTPIGTAGRLHVFNGMLFFFREAAATGYYTSTDNGASWVARTLLFTPSASSTLFGKASNDSHLILHAGNGAIWRTSDGINWTRATAGLAPTAGAQLDATYARYNNLAWIGEKFLCVFLHNSDFYVASSLDGDTWSDFKPITVDTSILVPPPYAATQQIRNSNGPFSTPGVTYNSGMISKPVVIGNRLSMLFAGYEPGVSTSSHGAYCLETVDGVNWSLDRFTSVAEYSLQNCIACSALPNKDGLAFAHLLGSTTVASVYGRTNPDFKELVYVE